MLAVISLCRIVLSDDGVGQTSGELLALFVEYAEEAVAAVGRFLVVPLLVVADDEVSIVELEREERVHSLRAEMISLGS